MYKPEFRELRVEFGVGNEVCKDGIVVTLNCNICMFLSTFRFGFAKDLRIFPFQVRVAYVIVTSYSC